MTDKGEEMKDSGVFKPGKPIKPTEDLEGENLRPAARFSRLQREVEQLKKAAADLRMRNLRLECDIARLEGVIEGIEKGLTAAAMADLIRTRAKPEPKWLSDEEAAVRARGVDRDFDPGWPR